MPKGAFRRRLDVETFTASLKKLRSDHLCFSASPVVGTVGAAVKAGTPLVNQTTHGEHHQPIDAEWSLLDNVCGFLAGKVGAATRSPLILQLGADTDLANHECAMGLTTTASTIEEARAYWTSRLTDECCGIFPGLPASSVSVVLQAVDLQDIGDTGPECYVLSLSEENYERLERDILRDTGGRAYAVRECNGKVTVVCETPPKSLKMRYKTVGRNGRPSPLDALLRVLVTIRISFANYTPAPFYCDYADAFAMPGKLNVFDVWQSVTKPEAQLEWLLSSLSVVRVFLGSQKERDLIHNVQFSEFLQSNARCSSVSSQLDGRPLVFVLSLDQDLKKAPRHLWIKLDAADYFIILFIPRDGIRLYMSALHYCLDTQSIAGVLHAPSFCARPFGVNGHGRGIFASTGGQLSLSDFSPAMLQFVRRFLTGDAIDKRSEILPALMLLRQLNCLPMRLIVDAIVSGIREAQTESQFIIAKFYPGAGASTALLSIGLLLADDPGVLVYDVELSKESDLSDFEPSKVVLLVDDDINATIYADMLRRRFPRSILNIVIVKDYYGQDIQRDSVEHHRIFTLFLTFDLDIEWPRILACFCQAYKDMPHMLDVLQDLNLRITAGDTFVNDAHFVTIALCLKQGKVVVLDRFLKDEWEAATIHERRGYATLSAAHLFIQGDHRGLVVNAPSVMNFARNNSALLLCRRGKAFIWQGTLANRLLLLYSRESIKEESQKVLPFFTSLISELLQCTDNRDGWPARLLLVGRQNGADFPPLIQWVLGYAHEGRELEYWLRETIGFVAGFSGAYMAFRQEAYIMASRVMRHVNKEYTALWFEERARYFCTF